MYHHQETFSGIGDYVPACPSSIQAVPCSETLGQQLGSLVREDEADTGGGGQGIESRWAQQDAQLGRSSTFAFCIIRSWGSTETASTYTHVAHIICTHAQKWTPSNQGPPKLVRSHACTWQTLRCQQSAEPDSCVPGNGCVRSHLQVWST
jgi:hypothetical protein